MGTDGQLRVTVGVAAASWLWLCAGSAAQSPEPATSDQAVRVFDFEEPGNPDPVPERWFRAQDDPAGTRRPGFPAFNRAEFDAGKAVSGKRSVRLPTRGGSTTLRLMPGDLAVFPDADYSVVAQVRTTELKHARAFVSARLLDQQLGVIPGSEVRSAPVLSPGVWTPARVTVPGRFPAAAWLQVELEVLQPAQFAATREDDPIAGYRVWHEDVEGDAWFDDVSVGLLPRTRFESINPTGILMAGQAAGLLMQVRDLGGRELVGAVRVLDIDGQEVWRREMTLQPDNRPERVEPRLPGFGWYRAVLEVSSEGRPVSRHEAHLLNLPARSGGGVEAGPGSDWDRAGIIADRVPEAVLPAAAATIRAAGTRFVVLPATDPSVDAAGARGALQRRLPTLTALLGVGQQVTLAVTGVPSKMASERSIDAGDILAMSQKDPEALLGLLEPTLDVLGQRIARYQVGTLDSTQALRTDPSGGASALEREIARLAPGPMIVLPWRAEFSLPLVRRVDAGADNAAAGTGNVAPGPLVDALSVRFPLGFPAWSIQDLAERSAAEAPGVELTIVPELPGAMEFGERARATEAGRRIVEFWRSLGETKGGQVPARIALDHPWTIEADSEPARLRPGVEIAVLAGVMDRLAGRRMIGAVPAPPGVRAYLFAARRGEQFSRGLVAAWNESARPEDAGLDLMRTDRELEVFDTFGNRLPAGPETPGTTGGGLVRIAVGESPVFVEHVDPYLTMFAASLKMEPGFVPAVVSEHEHRILLNNPWPIRLTGRLQIKQNEGEQSVRARSGDWTITPSVTDFSVGPGETASIPVTLAFGPGQLAGSKDLWIVAKPVADRTYPAVRVKTTLEVGLPDLELAPEAQLSPDGRDVVLLAIVTNKDTRPRSLRLETAARDVPSQQAQVSDLPPGQTVNKRFVFRGAAKALRGQRILVSLSDSEGASRLNRAVTVP